MVMVVDDDERIRTLLGRALSAEGHAVVQAADGFAALTQLEFALVDLVLLDLIMPRCDGYTVLSELRQRDDSTPVIVISGIPDIDGRDQAVRAGAVDFVPKPFGLAALLARVGVHLDAGHHHLHAEGGFLAGGGIRLDLQLRRVTIADDEVALTRSESSLLAHLMSREGAVCRREELLHDIWALDSEPDSNSVEGAIRRLRGKLPTAVIETIRGVGYCFHGIGTTAADG